MYEKISELIFENAKIEHSKGSPKMARNTRQEGSKGIVDISAGSTINTIGHNNIPLVDLVPLTELQISNSTKKPAIFGISINC